MRQPLPAKVCFISLDANQSWLLVAIGKSRSNADLTISYIQITRTQILVTLRFRQERIDLVLLISFFEMRIFPRL